MEQKNKYRVMLISVRNIKSIIQEELGIAYIASVLSEKGYEVKLKSCFIQSMDYNEICSYEPDVIGFSVYDDAVDSATEISLQCKKLLPNAVICWGGYAPTYHSLELMERIPYIDIIIKGEGELTFLQLMSCLIDNRNLENCDGILFRNNDKIIENKNREEIIDLDSLPFPNRDILVQNDLKVAYVSTSRGCTNRCSFCCSPTFFGKGWRGRSVISIISEIKDLIERYNVHRVHFIDNSFEDPDVHLSRMESILDAILENNINIAFTVDFRADFYRKVTDSIVKKLKKAGLLFVFLGIEAGNENDLEIYNKRVKSIDLEKSIEFFRENQIGVDIGFINFNPYSTLQTLRDNMDFLHRYTFDSYFLNIRKLRAYAGTQIYDRIKKDNLYLDDYSYTFVNQCVGNIYTFIEEYFEQGDMVKLVRNTQYYSVNLGHKLAMLVQGKLIKAENGDLTAQIREFTNRLNEALLEISKINYKWFTTLIELAEVGWNSDRAAEYTKELLNLEYLNRLMFGISVKEKKLFANMKKLGFQIDGM